MSFLSSLSSLSLSDYSRVKKREERRERRFGCKIPFPHWLVAKSDFIVHDDIMQEGMLDRKELSWDYLSILEKPRYLPIY
jgi:hypothetical protein